LPIAFASAAMIAMALLAVYVPMRRATRVGPHGSVATRV